MYAIGEVWCVEVACDACDVSERVFEDVLFKAVPLGHGVFGDACAVSESDFKGGPVWVWLHIFVGNLIGMLGKSLVLVLSAVVIVVVIVLGYQTLLSVGCAEGFTVPDELQAKYQKFAAFYNAFLKSWEKTVTTSWSTRIEPPPLSKEKPSAPTPTRAELNEEIRALSREGKVFPPITDVLPDTIESIAEMDGKVPSSPTPYLNALRWVNAKMEQSKRDMEDALQGKSGFEDYEGIDEGFNAMCGQMAQCQQEAEKKQTVNLGARLDAFNNNGELQRALQTNEALMEDAKRIQNQAQSGQLLNDLNLPPEPGTSFKRMEGADVLSTMSAEKNAELKANYRTWYDYKALLSQLRF